jgi:hypothetical protein
VWIREVAVLTEHSPWEVRSAYTDISDLKGSDTTEQGRGIPADFKRLIHDLQNQLHTLSMRLELAGLGLKEQIDPSLFLKGVGLIDRSVQDLHDFLISLGEGGFPPQDPAEILSDVLSSMQKELIRRSINLRLVRREPIPTVRADKEQLASAFERIIESCGTLLKKGGELKIEAGSKEVSGQEFAEFTVTSSAAAFLEFVEGQGSQPSMNLKVKNESVAVSLDLAAEILRRYHGRISFRKEKQEQGQLTVLMRSSRSGCR